MASGAPTLSRKKNNPFFRWLCPLLRLGVEIEEYGLAAVHIVNHVIQGAHHDIRTHMAVIRQQRADVATARCSTWWRTTTSTRPGSKHSEAWPMTPHAGTVAGRAILERRVIYYKDTSRNPAVFHPTAPDVAHPSRSIKGGGRTLWRNADMMTPFPWPPPDLLQEKHRGTPIAPMPN